MDNFPAKHPAEVLTLSFDFASLLGANTIDTATVTSSREIGMPDASPAAILAGSPQISGTKVLQQVHNGVDGTRYRLLATITSGTETYVLQGSLPILEK